MIYASTSTVDTDHVATETVGGGDDPSLVQK